MLRREPHAAASSPREGDTRPLIVPVSPASSGMPPAQAASGVPTPIAERLRAAGLHLAISVVIAGAVLALVFGAWYPSPLPGLLGVDAILLIMVAVDVVLGPLFTLIVFDRRKRRLAWDLATIGALQLAALVYGVYTVYQGRPAFVVLVKDRFEVVSPAELRPGDRAAARSNPHALIDPLAPRWVAARLPASDRERSEILMESLTRGRDAQHHPRLYVDYASEAPAALERSLPIQRLRELNPQRGAEIDAAVAASGRAEGALRYLPLRAPARDGAVLVDRGDGRVLAVTALSPW